MAWSRAAIGSPPFGEPGGHRLDALAVAVEEDPAEVGVTPVPPPRVPEGAGHRVEERGQVLPQLRQLPCVHELILPKTSGTARSRNGVILGAADQRVLPTGRAA